MALNLPVSFAHFLLPVNSNLLVPQLPFPNVVSICAVGVTDFQTAEFRFLTKRQA